MKKILKIFVTIGIVILLVSSAILYLFSLLMFSFFEIAVNILHKICTYLDSKGEKLFEQITGEKVMSHNEFDNKL